MKNQVINDYTCPNCQQSVHLNGACCPSCGMSAESESSGVPMIGNIPFVYFVVLVSIFSLSMMLYLPR